MPKIYFCRFVTVHHPKDGGWHSFFLLDQSSLSLALEAILKLNNELGNTFLLLASVDDIYLQQTNEFLKKFGTEKENFHHFSEPCGAWIRNKEALISEPTPPHCSSLTLQDADLVNSHWKYKSDKSLYTMEHAIQNYPSSCYSSSSENPHTSENLLSWAISRGDGSISNLFTMEQARGKGYANLLLMDLISKFKEQQAHVPPFCFIVNNNEPSEKCFKKLEFQKINQVDWIIAEWGKK